MEGHADLFEQFQNNLSFIQEDLVFYAKIINIQSKNIMNLLVRYWESFSNTFLTQSIAILILSCLTFLICFALFANYYFIKHFQERIKNAESVFLLVPLTTLYKSQKIKKYFEAKMSALND